MNEKLRIIIAFAVIFSVLGVYVYVMHKLSTYVDRRVQVEELERLDRELYRLQEESHFLYQVCRDQSIEYGVSASRCYQIASGKYN